MNIHTFDTLDSAFACRRAILADGRFPVGASVSVFFQDREYICEKIGRDSFNESVRMRRASVESPDWSVLDQAEKPHLRHPCIIH